MMLVAQLGGSLCFRITTSDLGGDLVNICLASFSSVESMLSICASSSRLHISPLVVVFNGTCGRCRIVCMYVGTLCMKRCNCCTVDACGDLPVCQLNYFAIACELVRSPEQASNAHSKYVFGPCSTPQSNCSLSSPSTALTGLTSSIVVSFTANNTSME
jgi:hypothetical protein